jgi:hypothetical protein
MSDLRWKLAVLPALGALMVLSACGRSAEARVKVTVELEEDGQTRTGSSIWDWRVSRPTIALASSYDTHFQGEAVAIPLRNHPTVFALLVNASADEHYAPLLVESLFGRGFANLRQTGQAYDRVADVADIANRVGERAELDCKVPDACPMLVWFENPSDPTSIQSADPSRFPEVGEDGVQLRSVTVEITRDQPVIGISKILPWLKSVGAARSTIIPRTIVRPGEGKAKPHLIPIQQIGTRSFSTELFS